MTNCCSCKHIRGGKKAGSKHTWLQKQCFTNTSRVQTSVLMLHPLRVYKITAPRRLRRAASSAPSASGTEAQQQTLLFPLRLGFSHPSCSEFFLEGRGVKGRLKKETSAADTWLIHVSAATYFNLFSLQHNSHLFYRLFFKLLHILKLQNSQPYFLNAISVKKSNDLTEKLVI